MSGYLTRLIGKTFGEPEQIRPVLPPLFAPAPTLLSGHELALEHAEQETMPREPDPRRGEPASVSQLPVSWQEVIRAPHPGVPPAAIPGAEHHPTSVVEEGMSPAKGTEQALSPRTLSAFPAEGPAPAAPLHIQAEQQTPPVIRAPDASVPAPPPSTTRPVSARAQSTVAAAVNAAGQRVVPAGASPQPIIPTPRGWPSERLASLFESGDLGERTEILPAPPSIPTVNVTIGRIEIRAVENPAAPQRKDPSPRAPRLSLQEYLRGQDGGRK
jgi:hypothetical protein